MRRLSVFAVAFCSLAVLASPGFAGDVEAKDENAAAAPVGVPEPLFLTCSVQVTCAGGSFVSCFGNNTCSTGGTNNRCVVCDGAQQGCCATTCCEACVVDRYYCLQDCVSPPTCGVCHQSYNHCVAECGGCP